MRYTDEKEITNLVRSFEDATVARSVWKHAEHLVVALYYVEHHDLDTATEIMRRGLFNLLVNGFGVDLEKEMPYHETLTVFWMGTVAAFSSSENGKSLIEKANDLVTEFDKDYPLRFYTREWLFSDEARARFVDPDLSGNEQV